MSFIINSQKDIDLGNWYSFPDGFSEEEIAEIERAASLSEFQEAILESGTDNLQSYRKSEIKWLNPQLADVTWVFRKFADMCIEANNALWHFEISGMFEHLQYTLYRDHGGHYDWHMDVGSGSSQMRKISIILQLSDPEEYEGGTFELFINKDIQQLPKKKGSVVLFPSYFMHRVTPVTGGNRKTIVLWVSGSSFK
jgi:PKHD-type hydroxylase